MALPVNEADKLKSEGITFLKQMAQKLKDVGADRDEAYDFLESELHPDVIDDHLDDLFPEVEDEDEDDWEEEDEDEE